MVMNQIIRERRKALGLTQEEVADYLGVSTPAVNKWETGKSYPDITMIPALARLLQTDANSLLSFEADLTKEKEVEIIHDAYKILEKEGYEAAYRTLIQKMKEYPESHSLILSGALFLEGGLLFLSDISEKERYLNEFEKMYERAMESDDLEVRAQAATLLVSKYINRQEFNKAEELLEGFPEMTFQKNQLWANLLTVKGEYAKAVEMMESQLLIDVTNVYNRLVTLLELSLKEEDTKTAEYLADMCEKTAEMYGCSNYSRHVPMVLLYGALKDKEKCMEKLKLLLLSLKDNWNPRDFPLYSRISPAKEGGMLNWDSLKSGIIRSLKEEEEFAFLRDDPEFRALIQG